MPSPTPAAGEVRSAPAALTVALLLALLPAAGCGRAAPSRTPAGAASPAATVQATIDEFNATAGGPVATQAAQLVQLVSSGQSSVQSSCARATSTIEFEPVYSRLTPAPGWKPTSGSLPGVVYALPTLIRVYTGDRITSTDLTDLHVAIDGGRGWLPALCLA